LVAVSGAGAVIEVVAIAPNVFRPEYAVAASNGNYSCPMYFTSAQFSRQDGKGANYAG